ncbi:MAG: MFS transporter [Actinomycetota bacterium]|nr:MFS transporter [Actinomycetota bacterium]
MRFARVRLASRSARVGARLGPLAERRFRLFFVGQTVSLLGDGMTPLALSFAVLGLTGSAADVGYVFGARMAPLVVLLLVGGVVADRVSPRTVVIGSDLVRFGSQAALAALLVSGRAEIWHLVALQAVNGAATGFFFPAVTGVAPRVVSRERLQQANALRNLAASGGEIAGPAFAGVLVATVGAGWALAVDAATFGVSAAFLAAVKLPSHDALPRQSFLRDLRDGWDEFRGRTWLWSGVVAAGLGNMVWTAFTVLGAVVSKQSLGGAGAWALILSSLSAGAFVGGLVALRVHPRRPFVAAFATYLLLPIPCVLLALELSPFVIAAGALAAGGGLIFGNTVWETTLQEQIPAAALSRVTAYDWLGSLALQPLGFALVGWVSGTVGVAPTLWFAAAALVATSATVLAVPSVRALERRGPADVAPDNRAAGAADEWGPAAPPKTRQTADQGAPRGGVPKHDALGEDR